MTELVNDIKNKLMANNVICSYYGCFTFDIMSSLLKMIKNELHKPEYEPSLAKNTYRVVVECLENVHKHSDNEKYEIVFTLSKNETGFVVFIGNIIPSEQKQHITEKLDYINNLARPELKEYYKSILSTGKISSKGGAGLGFVDIAMKAKTKLEYTFTNYRSNKHFYKLTVNISKPNK